MAVRSIAFEGTVSLNPQKPSDRRPIDLVLLANKTKGDKAAEVELLQLFARQARGCVHAFASDASHIDTKAAVRRLKSAAESVGASRVVAAVDAIDEAGATAETMATVAAAVLEAEHFILKLAR
ncbi:Hpt domain-containing protein [Peteryoungia desertarenae]|uniref:Hpt domain-containing protein n=1 Tax=Peteryoungia desertarenae TaxID=1813451 RepID=A0ABX6QQZ8_9HYPH|nr:Hpt domain-containing protein [Peteryoungia desertarenae]QLF70711.1 Hpt domain-containing protein [Peteryoungia desertarenae]